MGGGGLGVEAFGYSGTVNAGTTAHDGTPRGVGRSNGGNRRASLGERLSAGLAAAVALSPLVIASRLVPDPSGMGTHRQLGLPGCGWLVAFGKPCVTCGMTTAFSRMVHGEPWEAFVGQPAGALLALACAAVVWIGLHTCVFGSRAAPMMARAAVRTSWLVIGGGVLVGAWAYTIATWHG